MVHYAVEQRIPPKRLDDQLIVLRDPRILEHSAETLRRLAAEIKDHNFRIFAQGGRIHVLAANIHVEGEDPFRVFDQLMQQVDAGKIDAGHAFYLGYELCQAVTALTLGKHYAQDRALPPGHLPRTEQHHRLTRSKRNHPRAEQQSP
jgi:dihydropteroate synthase